MRNLLRLFPLLLLALAFPRPIEGEEIVQVGWWSQYAEPPTVATLAYRGFSMDDANAFIAVLDCSRIGEYAWIKVNYSGWIRAKVFDCLGADGNVAWWQRNNVLGEVDYYTAVTHEIEGIGGVRAHLAFEEDLQGLSDSQASVWSIPVDTHTSDEEGVNNSVVKPQDFRRSIFNDLYTISDVAAAAVSEYEVEDYVQALAFLILPVCIEGRCLY